jgi:tRNA pseudouridine13 synthase
MKLKRLPEDFQVTEEISLSPDRGPFGLYRLTKQSLGSLEAVGTIARRWSLPRAHIAFAGLKDKHALTTQYVTIHSGPRRGWSESNLTVEYVGQVTRAIHASDILANRFVIVVRDLMSAEILDTARNAVSIAADGVPNYFDDQRFGSLGESGEFIARPWCLGDYERALWLAIAEPNVHDRPADGEQKRQLRDNWGRWDQCSRLAPNSFQQRIVSFLTRHPHDYRRAIALAPHELRSIWLAAYQSHLWNQILAGLIRRFCRPEQCTLHTVARRAVPFFGALDDQQRLQLCEASLPLPSARLHLDDNPLKAIYDSVLAAEGIEMRQLRVKYPRDSFFSKGERIAIVQPADFRYDVDDDELYPDKKRLSLRFGLPRGAYATILLKHLIGRGDAEFAHDE